jgi:hypothetical protein
MPPLRWWYTKVVHDGDYHRFLSWKFIIHTSVHAILALCRHYFATGLKGRRNEEIIVKSRAQRTDKSVLFRILSTSGSGLTSRFRGRYGDLITQVFTLLNRSLHPVGRTTTRRKTWWWLIVELSIWAKCCIRISRMCERIVYIENAHSSNDCFWSSSLCLQEK